MRRKENNIKKKKELRLFFELNNLNKFTYVPAIQIGTNPW